MAEFKFASQVVEVSFVAAADPTMRVVTELVTAPVSGGGGGGGAGDVVGPSSSTDGRPVVFDGTSGKKVKQGAVNSPGGLLVLNEDGVVPESLIGTNIVRESEMATAISDAIDAIPTPVWPVDGTPDEFPPSEHEHVVSDLTDWPTSFPPEAHAHGIGDLTTTELSTSKVLQPDGSGGVAWGAATSGGGYAFGATLGGSFTPGLVRLAFANSGFTTAAGTTYYTGIYTVGASQPVGKLTFKIDSITGGTAKVRVAIIKLGDSTLQPASVAAAIAERTFTTTGEKTVSLPSTATLAPGLYVVGIRTDVAVAMSAMTMQSVRGWSGNENGWNTFRYLTVAEAYADWATTPTAWTTAVMQSIGGVAGSTIPVVWGL